MNMSFKHLAILGIAAAVTTATVPSLSVNAQSTIVEIDGSSTVFPITEAVAEEFQIANPGSRVTVGVSGSGGGFKRFCAGETHISNASRPIKDEEVALCQAAGIEFLELKVAQDALTVVVNKNNDKVSDIKVSELNKIWSEDSKVSNWSAVRSDWPAEQINLYGPGTDSGTFDYFNEVVIGKEGASRADFTASEDDNILVQGVSSDPLAMAYFGYAYYLENQDKLKALAIIDDEKGGSGVLPSQETVLEGTYTPFSRPLFIYVSKQALQDSEVKSFVSFYLENAADLAAEVGYVALPAEEYTKSKGVIQQASN